MPTLVRVSTGLDPLAEAQGALGSGDLDRAREMLTAAVAAADAPEARLLIGALDFADEDFAGAQVQWEEAFRAFRDADELRGAALAATYLGMLHYDAYANQSASRGWLSRAGRLLDRAGRCVERGYLELALVACNVRDAAALEESAAVALDLAIEFHDSDLEARALADGGLALISQGQLTKGFARLDEAMVPVSTGEVRNPMIGGAILCAMLTACERTGELRRAEEWTSACRDFLARRLSGRLPVLHAHCRLAYGTVLCDAGHWSEAETEILDALGPSATACVPRLAELAAALASLRLMQGRLDDAADLLAPHVDRFEVCEPLARLHFERGEYDMAAAVIERGLHELVGDRLRAGRLLHLLVEVELAQGHLAAAELSAERLADYAEDSDSAVLRAQARLSDGRVALGRGDPRSSIECLREARDELSDEERPMLTASIALHLAAALADAGETARAVDEARAALVSHQRLGARGGVARAGALLQDLGVAEHNGPA